MNEISCENVKSLLASNKDWLVKYLLNKPVTMTMSASKNYHKMNNVFVISN